MAASIMQGHEQYLLALKEGQKYYKACSRNNQYPYLPILDEILEASFCSGTADVGLVEIPSELIVGTRTAGRRTAFAGNFMPLLPIGTEFGSKWSALCSAHLGDEGIRDAVTCYEYMGKFYVEEGNKRVSVLKFFEAPTIPGKVIRMLPQRNGDPDVEIYYEFLNFYRYSRLYTVRFTRSGCYAKLQAALGFDSEHYWTEDERRAFSSQFTRFRTCLTGKYDLLGLESADVLLLWLRTNDFWQMKQMSQKVLLASIDAMVPDLKILAGGNAIRLSTQPDAVPEESFLEKLIGGSSKPKHLSIAFIHSGSVETSAWVRGHELGREYLEQKFQDRISVRSYFTTIQDADTTIEESILNGAELIIATSPPLMPACLKAARNHKDVRVLNCSLSMPYSNVRTYYSRLYEAKFICGAIAGAMCHGDYIGYVANYPILGIPATINAFALGAQLTHPGVTIKLRWSCLPGNPIAQFAAEGVKVISNRDTVKDTHEYGTYSVLPNGTLMPLTSSCWNWGKFYSIIADNIFNGGWNPSDDSQPPVNYWWGMNTGVIDFELSDTLPEGVVHLATILREGIKSGSLDPFLTLIRDQSGTVRNDGDHRFTPEEVIHMDWLCDCVEGRIPDYEEILPASRELVRLLGVHRDEIPPEKEGLLL